jgi:hypothetical protein
MLIKNPKEPSPIKRTGVHIMQTQSIFKTHFLYPHAPCSMHPNFQYNKKCNGRATTQSIIPNSPERNKPTRATTHLPSFPQKKKERNSCGKLSPGQQKTSYFPTFSNSPEPTTYK